MDIRPKRKLTTYEKIMKYMGLSFLALFVIFLIWLFGFKISFVNVNDSNLQQITVMYRGKNYYNQSAWRVRDTEFAGFAEGLSSWVYKSTGSEKKKFLEIWQAFNVSSRGYGTFYTKDIELTIPSSDNTKTIEYFGNIQLDEALKKGVLFAFDSYLEDKSIGIPKQVFSEYVTIFCEHKEYNLYCKIRVSMLDDKYYMQLVYDDSYLIPIPSDIGKQIIDEKP